MKALFAPANRALITLLAASAVSQGGCAESTPPIRMETAPDGLVARLGYPRCRLSQPLQVGDVVPLARFLGVLMIEADMHALHQSANEEVKAGSELREIDCRYVHDKIVEGSVLLVSIKNEAVVTALFELLPN